MNNDDVRTYAAFIGAILGIINFVWNIVRTVRIGFKYKILKAKIKREVYFKDRFAIFCIGKGFVYTKNYY